jgi:rfaE bifunctional protein kinase chain/domain
VRNRTRAHDRLLEILDRFPRCRLAVVGDLIADEFLHGSIARISREAPVLVLEYRDLVSAPGGAANAAHNLLELRCGVSVAGAVGQDAAGRTLLRQLAAKGADLEGVRRLRAYTTPVKTRILAGAPHSGLQQIVRIDRLSQLDGAAEFGAGSLRKALAGCDGAILSDYGYGMAAPAQLALMRSYARKRRIPLVVDSRFRLLDFPGVTSLTPNITELEAALGRPIGSHPGRVARAAREVLQRLHLETLLVTQGRFGMTLVERGRPGVHIPIFGTDEVADVTGAGDTVIATFTAALACRAEPVDAARLANYAAGLVVMKRGTATVALDELRDAVVRDAAVRA